MGNYKRYIELGFERIDMNDSVEFDQTGYKGFVLKKEVNENIVIFVDSQSLDKPKLHIKKSCDDLTNHIIVITFESASDFLNYVYQPTD